MKRIAGIFLFIAVAGLLQAQNCVDHLNIQKSGIKYPYKYDSQSKSGLFFAGKSSTINMVCSEGKEYKLSFLVSSNIMKSTSIRVTDENGKEYFSMGENPLKKKDLESKRQLMISLENKKLTIKASKDKKKLQLELDNLKLEISKSEQEVNQQSTMSKPYFDFMPASTMTLTIEITTAENCPSKGCVGILLANKPMPGGGF